MNFVQTTCHTLSFCGITLLSSTPALADGSPFQTHTLQKNTADTIQRTVRSRRSRVMACYEQELAQDPSLSGRIEVRFDIEDARPDRIEVTGMSSSLQSCVRRSVAQWRFTGVDAAYGIELTYDLQPS